MSSKVFYEVDPHNRLIIKRTGGHSNLKRFRKVVNGRFKVDKRNGLYYEVFKGSKSEVPQKIKFGGRYSLDKKANLVFTMDKWNNQYAGNRLRLKTGIIDANDSQLFFMLRSKVSESDRKSYILKLDGRWYSDKNNRIGFKVEKGTREIDELIFSNAWRLNKDNEIEYSYKKDSGAIRLKGAWNIKNRYRLNYVLDREINSGFDFKTSLGRIRARKNKMYARFDVEIGISEKRRVRRKIIFLGAWKIGGKRDVFLEISPGRKKNLVLKLEKGILGKDGLVFLESFLKGKERYLGGGIILRW